MTTTLMDDVEKSIDERPGAQLAVVRKAKGYTIEYIANKLHLRMRLVEALEADDYKKLPSAVFVQGYLRAYAKLVDLNAEPLLETYKRNYMVERKHEKAALWQSRRDTNSAERAIRWLTTIFGLVVLIAVAIWWHKSSDNQNIFASATKTSANEQNASEHAQVDIRLTDLSKMRSLLSSESQYSSVEPPENQYSSVENASE